MAASGPKRQEAAFSWTAAGRSASIRLPEYLSAILRDGWLRQPPQDEVKFYQ
jgi:hypothetical protein